VTKENLKNKIESIVAKIPEGRVMTYGQLAALAGNPRAARIVGGIAHFGNTDLPWHRVVNKLGGLASGYPGGRKAHAEHLKAEGVQVKSENGIYKVDIEKLVWWPNK
jgi:methylated-DNA-protein-cysteine methyltransferase-like protein